MSLSLKNNAKWYKENISSIKTHKLMYFGHICTTDANNYSFKIHAVQIYINIIGVHRNTNIEKWYH